MTHTLCGNRSACLPMQIMYWDPKSVRGGEQIDGVSRRRSLQLTAYRTREERASKRVTASASEFSPAPMAQRQFSQDDEEDINDTLDEIGNNEQCEEEPRQELVTNSYGYGTFVFLATFRLPYSFCVALAAAFLFIQCSSQFMVICFHKWTHWLRIPFGTGNIGNTRLLIIF